jgi:hypothetical protein
VTLLVFAWLGCSSDAGSGHPSAPVDPSCSAMAAAHCSLIESCLPIFLRTEFGNVDSCIERLTVSCAAYAKWPGTSFTSVKMDRCAQAAREARCDNLQVTLDAACSIEPGALPEGAACYSASQCMSGSCNVAFLPDGTTSGCGKCTKGCGDGSVCLPPATCIVSASGMTCRPPLPEGAPCTPGAICAIGLTCIASVCSKPAGEGARCAGASECDVFQELACVDETCRKVTVVQAGEGCSAPGVRCGSGTYCGAATPSSSTPSCMAYAADGSPCSDMGLRCQGPAICAGGACKLPADLVCE